MANDAAPLQCLVRFVNAMPIESIKVGLDTGDELYIVVRLNDGSVHSCAPLLAEFEQLIDVMYAVRSAYERIHEGDDDA